MTTLGLFGLGAFGRLAVRHLAPHFAVTAYDPAPQAADYARENDLRLGTLEAAAGSNVVVLAAPVERLGEVAASIRPYLKSNALVLDVTSVKVKPAEILREALPDHPHIVGTHPLFGPQSARDGIKDLKIAVCPIRGDREPCVTAFLRDTLGLNAIVTTPEEHDREMAAVQGLTHMVAKILTTLEPLPSRLTTVSFDHLVKVVNMLRHDSLDLFLAIQRDNPFAAGVRDDFFAKARDLQRLIEETPRKMP